MLVVSFVVVVVVVCCLPLPACTIAGHAWDALHVHMAAAMMMVVPMVVPMVMVVVVVVVMVDVGAEHTP